MTIIVQQMNVSPHIVWGGCVLRAPEIHSASIFPVFVVVLLTAVLTPCVRPLDSPIPHLCIPAHPPPPRPTLCFKICVLYYI